MTLPMVPAGSNGVQHFRSRPDLQPASITVNQSSASTYNGDIFVDPAVRAAPERPDDPRPVRATDDLVPAVPANQLATDFRVQQLGSQPVLTWWQGFTNNGCGSRRGRDLQPSYQQIATVQAGNGLQGMDLHEFLVTPQGDAWHRRRLARPLRAPCGKPLMDAVVQEIDIKTGLVLFEWHALDHVPITESFFKRTRIAGTCTTRTT